MPEELFAVPDDWWRHRRCQVCGGALSVTCTHTYLVQRQGWVKIGATSNVRRRLNELRRPAWTHHLISPPAMDWHEPLAVLGVLDIDIEHQLHQRFALCHAAGEWFRPDGEMRTWLADVPPPAMAEADYPVAPVRWTRPRIPDSLSGNPGQEAALW